MSSNESDRFQLGESVLFTSITFHAPVGLVCAFSYNGYCQNNALQSIYIGQMSTWMLSGTAYGERFFTISHGTLGTVVDVVTDKQTYIVLVNGKLVVVDDAFLLSYKREAD